MKKIAIIGANGFIGGNMQSFFKAEGFDVLPLGKEDTKKDIAEITKVLEDVDIIINLAKLSEFSVNESAERPKSSATAVVGGATIFIPLEGIIDFGKEVRRLEMEIQGYRKREETFKRALLNSQKVLDQMKDNARKSAELIIAEAEVKAEKILNNAHNRLAQLHEDISELKRQRMQIEVQIGSIIEAHSKLLEISKEGTKAMDEEDAKLKLELHLQWRQRL